ncbi:aminomethyltransferase, mitochondrial [Ooceraea biroi]|uniref:Aminomethyltransferase n=1 Tax=Ooceraea biroi TaxID=2015173 RepID=A0A026WVF9_OOCBI|nr:aminomethyltransferase, mitochondrial [Ooceraea biroi]EZA59968.1 Aminomethyltransferase, mitochondrial [Ooceraea biroi]
MLRFGARGRFVICDNLEKCLDALGGVRDTCSIVKASRIREKRVGGSTSRSNCLIDFLAPRAATKTIQKENCRQSSTSAVNETQRTCLYDFHVEKQGKIVNFAGWLLPVQYRETIAVSHLHTRSLASLFDVSHMLQTRVSGKDAGEFLESLTTCDLINLNKGAATLTVFTNDNGGILDDLIITKDDENRYFVVSNAGRRDEDVQLLLERQEDFKKLGKNVFVDFLNPLQHGLVALQGPTAAKVLQSLVKIDLSKLKFMNSVKTEVADSLVRVSRCGYTGEDGFEISVPAKDAVNLVERILEIPDIKLAGLGARDSLRLEAGLCLYGHDINEETTPVEAALTWLVAKRRRAEANFPGAQRILSQIKTGAKKKRVGLLLGQGPPAREGAPILTPEGERVGSVTSGGPSPTLGRPIAMGYMPPDLAQFGGGVLVEVRGKTYKATVTKMPFVKANYYTAK